MFTALFLVHLVLPCLVARCLWYSASYSSDGLSTNSGSNPRLQRPAEAAPKRARVHTKTENWFILSCKENGIGMRRAVCVKEGQNESMREWPMSACVCMWITLSRIRLFSNFLTSAPHNMLPVKFWARISFYMHLALLKQSQYCDFLSLKLQFLVTFRKKNPSHFWPQYHSFSWIDFQKLHEV